jgi:carbamoyltransferase
VGELRGGAFAEIDAFPQSKSLGVLYLEAIKYIGYASFDEYKVMGLAPYGDPERFLGLLRTSYALLPDGKYDLALDRIDATLKPAVERRAKGAPITQAHMDLAAGLQSALEEIVLHVLRHHQRASGHRRLCLAGGVAHNCTMNGKIARSGMFEEIFVQPAAHDAGCALGAALAVSVPDGAAPRPRRLSSVYWGRDVGDDRAIRAELDRWSPWLTVERSADVARTAASLIAGGAVIGWVQGRSEFGPRALGHRSILADPRPAENKDRINRMVKKREAYRPFAPSVLEERAHEFFVLPQAASTLGFMVIVLEVREDRRELLGAITHVDGTARVQTVSRAASPRYWDVIHAFGELTGVPVLLNTSFNNNA